MGQIPSESSAASALAACKFPSDSGSWKRAFDHTCLGSRLARRLQALVNDQPTTHVTNMEGEH
jgi:hypothetical protein